MFFKNSENKAFNSLKFLIKYGFSLKKYTRLPDIEHVYSNKNIVIEVDYYLGVYPNGVKSMCVDVILTVDKCRNNLLKSEKIFGAELLETLKAKVNAVTALEQISVYAEFIETNINVLFQYIKE